MTHRFIIAEYLRLMETPDLTGTIMRYEVDGKTFEVENTGVILCVSEFGMAEEHDEDSSTNKQAEIRDCLALFIGGYKHSIFGIYHKGYSDLLPKYKQASQDPVKP